MLNEITKNIILKYLHSKLPLDELEQDLFDSLKDLDSVPPDENKLWTRIIYNRSKYENMIANEKTFYTKVTGEYPVVRPVTRATLEDLQISLSGQILALAKLLGLPVKSC